MSVLQAVTMPGAMGTPAVPDVSKVMMPQVVPNVNSSHDLSINPGILWQFQ